MCFAIRQHVWTSPGYTKVTLKFLQSPTHFITRGVVRCLGGPNGVKEEVKSQCLSRMLAWMKLAEEVVRAEHPAFELVPCFSLFDLNQFPQQTAARIKQEDFSQKFDAQLERAANSLELDMQGLKQEFFDLGQIAYGHWKEHRPTCSNLDRWKSALAKTSSAAARRQHPVDNLEVALAHYATLSASDSVLERDFSRMKHTLGEKRLQCDQIVENELLMLTVADPDHDKEVISLAQRIWSEIYAPARKRSKARFDKGVKRNPQICEDNDEPEEWQMTPEKVTESEFKKRRRLAVQRGMENPHDPHDKVVACSSAAWTDDHDRELHFNAKKEMKQIFECLRSGTVKINEVPAEMLPEAISYFEKKEANMLKRERAELRLGQQVRRREQPPVQELHGLAVMVADDLRCRQLDNAMDQKDWHVTLQLASAQVLVLPNLNNLPLSDIHRCWADWCLVDNPRLCHQWEWAMLEDETRIAHRAQGALH